MNYRERFEATVDHKPVDRVPFDLAGTCLSSIEHEQTIDALRRCLDIEGDYTGDYAAMDERILQRLDIDFRRVGGIIQQPPRQISPTESLDQWGVKRVFTGLYWDIVDPPLKGATVDDLCKYPFPGPQSIDRDVIRRYTEQAKHLRENTPYVIGAEHPVFGVMELGCWMCGFDDFLLKLALDPDFIISFFDIVYEYQKAVIDAYYGELGRYIHFTTSGDDFGTQTGPFLSPAMFAQFVKPYMKARIAYTRRHTDAHFFHHTCGSVFALIPHLIDAGVEILNPIQPGAKDMELDRLKAAYGDKITFWGGVDTQHLLPFGTAEEVKAQVRQILSTAGTRGGYVLSPAHNIQPDVRAENLAAMFDGAREYYRR